MTFAIKGGGRVSPAIKLFRSQKQVFWVQKHCFKPVLVCFENGKWKKVPLRGGSRQVLRLTQKVRRENEPPESAQLNFGAIFHGKFSL